jgi:hypothetical protein
VAQPDHAPVGVAVLGHVGQGLGDHEIRGCLYGRVQPAVQAAGIEVNGYGRARGQGDERLAQAAVDEDRRGDATRQGPQLVQRLLGLDDRVGERLPDSLRPAVQVVLGAAQFHRQADQPLLGPVVDVAFEPAQRGRLGCHRGDGLRAGGVPLLLQPADPAVQRGRVRQQCLPQPGLGHGACPGHERQGEQQQQAGHGTESETSGRRRQPQAHGDVGLGAARVQGHGPQ